MKANLNHLKTCGYLSLGLGMGLSSISAFASDTEASKNNAEKKEKPMNVLFIMSDDMRTDWNCYGTPQMHTPNFDKLASQGVLFHNNYCQYPLSGPSRTSLLSGHRPTSTRIYDNSPWWGADHPEWPSLPMYFKQNGYTTYGVGKVFHAGIEDTDAFDFGGKPRARNKGVGDFRPSYVSEADHALWVEQRGGGKRLARSIQNAANYQSHRPAVQGDGHGRNSDRWYESDTEYKSETTNTDIAIGYIKEAAQKDEPFFIACGYSKPHTPFVAPQEFFDLYDINDIPLPPDFASLPMNPFEFPKGAIRETNADLFINRPATAEDAKDFIRAYWACISYVDWNVGRLIAALDESGMRENTIIVFCVDHGFQLGEKGKWSKAGSLWEEGTKVPLLIVDPRAKGNGQASKQIVENLDIYPTLIELCGLPENKDLEGTSIAKLLDNPNAEWDKPAYTVWNNHGKGVTGVSVRVNRWRYAEYFGAGAGAMLIDEENDPHELENLVRDPQYADLVAKLHELAIKYVEGQRELTKEEAEAQGLLK